MKHYIKRIEFKDIDCKDIITEKEIIYGDNGITIYLEHVVYSIFIPYSSIQVIETTIREK